MINDNEFLLSVSQISGTHAYTEYGLSQQGIYETNVHIKISTIIIIIIIIIIIMMIMIIIDIISRG